MSYYCNIEINNKTRSKIDLALVKKVAEKFLKYYKKRIRRGATNAAHANENIEVSIAFIGDKTIRRLNKTYRGINKITDVLAFPDVTVGTSPDNEQSNFLGEIIINYIQVKRQAKRFGNSIRQELVFILVHGLLHLLGYDDKTEKGRREMERLGKEFINKLKMQNAK
ncbi:rRNA maturation RNase YbeY [Candidatus Parcubacteria bacterium]|nr:rRNA maturation RNase YbeY [Candidatus Parcubacteria bacterium]